MSEFQADPHVLPPTSALLAFTGGKVGLQIAGRLTDARRYTWISESAHRNLKVPEDIGSLFRIGQHKVLCCFPLSLVLFQPLSFKRGIVLNRAFLDLDWQSTTKRNSCYETPGTLIRNTMAHLGAGKVTSFSDNSLNNSELTAKRGAYINRKDLPPNYELPHMPMPFQLSLSSPSLTPRLTKEKREKKLPPPIAFRLPAPAS